MSVSVAVSYFTFAPSPRAMSSEPSQMKFLESSRWVLSYVYSKQPIFGLTQKWFRELSFSRLECGLHDRLYIYPRCGIFYFPLAYAPDRSEQWICVSSERHRQCGVNKRAQVSKRRSTEQPRPTRDTQSLMSRARFITKYNMPGPGIEPRTTACQADLLTTALPRLWVSDAFDVFIQNWQTFTYDETNLSLSLPLIPFVRGEVLPQLLHRLIW